MIASLGVFRPPRRGQHQVGSSAGGGVLLCVQYIMDDHLQAGVNSSIFWGKSSTGMPWSTVMSAHSDETKPFFFFH